MQLVFTHPMFSVVVFSFLLHELQRTGFHSRILKCVYFYPRVTVIYFGSEQESERASERERERE